MIEAMEAELTEMDSRNDNLAVTEEANVDEAIPIDLRKEKSTESYKETMRKDINNIDTYETRTKVNTTKWRPIYEVIYEADIKGSIFSHMILLKNVRIIQTKHVIYHAM